MCCRARVCVCVPVADLCALSEAVFGMSERVFDTSKDLVKAFEVQ
jgi:hypothetical protein